MSLMENSVHSVTVDGKSPAPIEDGSCHIYHRVKHTSQVVIAGILNHQHYVGEPGILQVHIYRYQIILSHPKAPIIAGLFVFFFT